MIQADGRDDLDHGTDLGKNPTPPTHENFGDTSDPFPGSKQVTFYEDVLAGIRFENIRIEDNTIKLDIIYKNKTTTRMSKEQP
ncbi:MAG TPA: hypothetical protein DD708_08280 [Deltaproteobacteria bacterium]|nr:hypothetical protein [Deltaproteobacteria bacterium]